MANDNKFMVDDLTLMTGQMVMIPDPPLMMTQPTLHSIGLLGQANFYTAVILLAYPSRVVKLSKEMKDFQFNDFDIIMQVMRAEDDASKINSSLALMLLSMMFPQYEIKAVGNMILLNQKENGSQVIINSNNYENIRQAIIQIFKLEELVGSETIDNKDDSPMVKRIKEKFRKRHEILAKKNKGSGKMDILSRYMSIVSIGLNIPMTDIKQYTVYELFDNYKRAQLKDEFDLYVKRATSFGGVKKEEKVVNWQKSLDEIDDNKR